jgi:hypothetical protein
MSVITKRLEFELQEVFAQHVIARTTLDKQPYLHNVQALLREEANNLLMTLHAFVPAQKKTHTVRYPADWWQAVKDRWYPAWALSRWPVVYRQITVDAHRTWEHLPVTAPDKWGQSFEFVIDREEKGTADALDALE